ncbi:MAG: hypothetical protein ACTSX6_00175 [Candidatus Heimdallarchaeaceae archaeon]
MVELPVATRTLAGAMDTSTGNIIEEKVFKAFLTGNGKSYDMVDGSNRIKRTFLTEDGKEWVIWGDKSKIAEMFKPINEGDRIKITYRVSTNKFGEKYNNVRDVKKIYPQIQEASPTELTKQHYLPSVDEPIVSAKGLDGKNELLQKLNNLIISGEAFVSYLKELRKSVEVTAEIR